MKMIFESKLSMALLIASIVCLIYSGIVLLVRSGTFSFLMWIALAAVFILFAWLLDGDRWSSLPLLARQLIGTAAGISIAVFIVCQGAIFTHFFDKGTENLDYIIVLGAQMRSSGPSIVYKYRLDKAYEYLMENENTVCIISGGKGTNELQSEGEGGRDYLLSKGLSEDRIIVESKSVDTVGNIRNSFLLIDEEGSKKLRIGIVTNNFHLYRGMGIAKKVTEDEIYGIAAYMQPLYLPNNMLRETFGIIRDYLNGDL